METSNNNEYKKFFIASGGRCLSGHSMVQSLLAQYPQNNISVDLYPNILSIEDVNDVVMQAKKEDAVIIHTMVCADIRQALSEACKANSIPEFDYMGPLANYIENELGMKSISEPGLYRKSNEKYFDRISAIEYTLGADDGVNPENLREADIILTGVSRAGKTPLSIYMSMLGWRVANVPLVLGIDPPHQLFAVDPQRVFGLKISQVQLTAHRMKRLIGINNEDNTSYVDKRMINDEIRYADRIFEKGGFTVVNVSNKPIESSSNEIIKMITDRFDYSDQKTTSIY
ncbi:MAG TPA: pyruvate, water dikinase regulatory protein [Prolixibacteraceae bacterium]|nr:pyruvate, water dikinase regulatory protein [Prolixibacteraceae bacterium]